MADKTPIEWCDSTVNPTAGCDGCELWTDKIHSCYAGNIYPRLGYGTPFGEVVHLRPGVMTKAAAWSDLTGKPRSNKPWLNSYPRMIFISDMSDALSQSVSFDYLKTEIIDTVLSDRGRRHQWMWPTKQPKRMAEFSAYLKALGVDWPRHLWAGTSITTQKTTNRINHLLKVGEKDTLRFVSVEPQLEAVDIARWLPKLDWVIQGGESHQRSFKARPFDMIWADSMIADCKKFDVPIFVKQMGAEVHLNGRHRTLKNKKGGDWKEWSKSRRVRQFPTMPDNLTPEEASVVMTLCRLVEELCSGNEEPDGMGGEWTTGTGEWCRNLEHAVGKTVYHKHVPSLIERGWLATEDGEDVLYATQDAWEYYWDNYSESKEGEETMAKKRSRKKPSSAEETLTTKLEKLADHTSRVGRQIQNGLFIYGRSGTSKTYTVTKTLENLGCEVAYNNGHVNHEPLFDMFCEHPSGIVILDDVSHILSDKKILNMLLAALGSQADSDVRKITYKSSLRKKLGKPEEVDFTGGVILISNITIGAHSLHQPLLGRTFPHEHDLTNEEMRVLYYIIAKAGYTLKRQRHSYKLTPKDCKEVADCVLEKCEEIGLQPNVRHLVEVAYKCRIDEKSQFHWKTHVEDGLREAKKLDASIKAELASQGSGISELIECIQEATSKQDAREKWMEITGNSRPTFFRKLKELSSVTKDLYEKLDRPNSSTEKAEAERQRVIFRETLEDLVEMLEDDHETITKAMVLDGRDDPEEFLSQLREQPTLQKWFDALP